jgi:putative DNA primase/helicase
MKLYDKMQSLDIPVPPANITANNGFKRWGKNNCYWLIEKDGAAFFGDYSTGDSHQWFADDGQELSPADFAKRKEKMAVLNKEREAETIRRQAEAKAKAAELLKGVNTPEQHLYLQRKQINSCAGLKVGMWQQRQKPDCLLIPMRDSDGVLWNMQAIFPEKDQELGRDKDFLFGGRKQGLYFPIGKPDGVICICEGFATGASIHEATGYAVAVAFDAGNLEAVATAIKAKYPAAEIIICADNDQFKDSNTGIEKARKAAASIGAAIAIPAFANLETKPTDFNDLHCLEGLEAVKNQLIENVASQVLPEPEELSDTIKKLSELPPIEYEKVRDAEAEKLGIRVSALDAEIKSIRKKELGSSTVAFPEVTVWNEPVDAGELLNELAAVTKRFIICDHETAIAVALWCAFTWFIEYVHVSPLAVITAPEKRCGKSQLLNLIGKLASRPLVASNISPSAVFRVIEAYQPTLLIDEADSFFKDNEELRGVINSGHTRQSAYVIRNVGDNHEPKQFSTWGAKAISGIGSLSDTLMDRAVVLNLRRKLPHENVERLRHAEAGLFDILASKLARFAIDAGGAVSRAKPELPEALNDRAQDNWEPLLAIADYAGVEWGKLARVTAIKLSADRNENLSFSAELLADIKEVFETKGADRISSADLIESLCADDEKSWATYNRGKPITTRQFARRLREYHISSKPIRSGYSVSRGFELEQFEDAFSRYLISSSDTPYESVTSLQSTDSLVLSVTDRKNVTVTQMDSVTRKPASSLDCNSVTDFTTPAGKIVEVEL